uniref:Endonuclease/exonuclease/phosphatase domain-containing protein n=1 Tax=Lotharella oceanica TaxID=641309 RepID=A0A7S2U3Q7_9EUKA
MASARPLQAPPHPGITVVSWNVLAPRWCSKERFPHSDVSCMEWNYRKERILEKVQQCQADVVCLQEVEVKVWEGELEAKVESMGYKMVKQQEKKKGIKAVGNAILYKTATFNGVEFEVHRSRVMALGLMRSSSKSPTTDQDAKELWVIACAHLDATKPKHRLSQLKSMFKHLEKQKLDCTSRVVVCGDFNAEPHSDVAKTMRNREERANESPGLVFESAYSAHWKKEPMTYSVKGWNGTLDYLWYTHSSIGVTDVRPVFDSSLQADTIKRQGLPSADIPSDHMPIGATFIPVEPSEEIKLLIKAKADAKEARSRAKAKAKSVSCERKRQRCTKGGIIADERKASSKSARKRQLKLERLQKNRNEKLVKGNEPARKTRKSKGGTAKSNKTRPGSCESWVMVNGKSSDDDLEARTNEWVIIDATSTMDVDDDDLKAEAEVLKTKPQYANSVLFPALFRYLTY